MTYLSPRIRADYLLLIDAPKPRQCLEAFSTEEGVDWCVKYDCVIKKATLALPALPALLGSLTPMLVAAKVASFLDNASGVGNTLEISGLLDD
jgi:hypothetical protein